MEILAKEVFPEKSKIWLERFEILGGVPRMVFERSDTDDASILVNDAVTSCNLKECITAVRSPGVLMNDHSKTMHSLVHIFSEDYETKHVDFASKMVFRRALYRYEADGKYDMYNLLASCRDLPVASTLSGHIYERYAMETLAKGGSFKCRKLCNKQPFTMTIPKSDNGKPIMVKKVSSSDQHKHQMYFPENPNYPAIDAWMPDLGGFQMTVSATHPIKTVSSLVEDLGLLSLGDNAHAAALYFVVPAKHFDSFKNPTLVKDVKQFVLQVVYPSFVQDELV